MVRDRHEDAETTRATVEDLLDLRTAIQLAQEVGTRLGCCSTLLGALPPGARKSE
jgi:hypothetical protein